MSFPVLKIMILRLHRKLIWKHHRKRGLHSKAVCSNTLSKPLSFFLVDICIICQLGSSRSLIWSLIHGPSWLSHSPVRDCWQLECWDVFLGKQSKVSQKIHTSTWMSFFFKKVYLQRLNRRIRSSKHSMVYGILAINSRKKSRVGNFSHCGISNWSWSQASDNASLPDSCSIQIIVRRYWS